MAFETYGALRFLGKRQKELVKSPLLYKLRLSSIAKSMEN